MPIEYKGGVFASSDIPVIKRALHVYLIDCMRSEGHTERDPHPDVSVIANLLHRLGRLESSTKPSPRITIDTESDPGSWEDALKYNQNITVINYASE